MKFVAGPASDTNSMWWRPLRIWFGLTGTGLAQREHREAGERAERGQDDRAERVDVRDRVQREPPGLAGGVVAEPQRDDAVADLVEDHRDHERDEPQDRDVIDLDHEGLSGAWMRT